MPYRSRKTCTARAATAPGRSAAIAASVTSRAARSARAATRAARRSATRARAAPGSPSTPRGRPRRCRASTSITAAPIVVASRQAATGATLRLPGRARWGVSGSLNPKSAPCGAERRPRDGSSGLGLRTRVDDRVPRTGSVRTASGPEGSSAKDSLSGAAAPPDPSTATQVPPVMPISKTERAAGHLRRRTSPA